MNYSKRPIIPELQPRHDAIAALIVGFCDEYLDSDYKDLCLHALYRLCRQYPIEIAKGKAEMWAAGIVHAIAQNCFLVGNKYSIFTGKPKYHLMADQICVAFGVSKGGTSAKAKLIRDALHIAHDQIEWLPPSMHEITKMVTATRCAMRAYLKGQSQGSDIDRQKRGGG